MAAIHAEETVRHVVRAHLGRAAERVRPLDNGHAAQTYAVTAAGRRVVVKLYRGEDRSAWMEVVRKVLDEVRAAGLPAPRLLGCGCRPGPCSYVLYQHLEGVPANVFAGDLDAAWRAAGRLAAQLNALPAPGFGTFGTPMGGTEPYARSWQAFAGPATEPLLGEDLEAVLPPPDDDLVEGVRTRLRALATWRFAPTLVHGNLTESNLMVDPRDGALVGIIDWDGMLFARAPHFELATALLWLSPSRRRAFLEGYGLTPGALAALEPEVRVARVFVLVRYLFWHHATGNRPLADAVRAQIRQALAP